MEWRCIAINTFINTFLFDLDGTLLPLDQDQFIKIYFHKLALKFEPLGYNPQEFVKAVFTATEAMIKNDGTQTNEVTFWNTFLTIIKADYQALEETFLDFYKNDFKAAKVTSRVNPIAAKCIDLILKKGYQIALPTNPLFPQVATYQRIEWAGLKADDFIYVTTYENSSYCKPNLKYYEELLNKINKTPHECIMVGNDVSEDMVVSNLGMETFLLTDCLINTTNKDISNYHHGDFNALYRYIDELPSLK